MERLACTLAELVTLTRERGLGGYAILNQCGGKTPYVAKCVNFAGELTDPTTFDTHATPLEALEALAEQLRRAKTERELGAGI